MRRSDNITAGPERMPNRSLLRACGMTDEEMKQPIIGVVSAYSEIIRAISTSIRSRMRLRQAFAWQAVRRCSFRPSAYATALPWVTSA